MFSAFHFLPREHNGPTFSLEEEAALNQKQLGILIQIGLINYTLLLHEFTLVSSCLVQCTPV